MRWSVARRWLSIGRDCAIGWILFTFALSPLVGQAPSGSEQDATGEKQIIERFVGVLERNPRRGTALDKIYGFHVENGSLDALVKQLEDRVAATPDDSTGWMILGLVESQRGRDSAAVRALTRANVLRVADPLASFYLGQSLVLIGEPEKAALALEQAIARKPAQADLLEIFQALARVHQRAQRNSEALAVWGRLEKLFPTDPRVQEQIAVTMAEEGQYAEALPRYEALIKATTDDYRRTTYRIEAAELKVKLNRRSESIADFEQLLAGLNPESWLFREVRRKIEDVFLRTDDQDGLAAYYTKWLASHSDDVDAMARLARVLSRQARAPEAKEWLTKALKLAPSRKDLRQALIEQLLDEQQFAQAIEQYAELDKLQPNNPDVLRDWGKLVLRDAARSMEQRQAEAERIWRKLLAARPADPLAATQVADLLRHAQMQPQALELYQTAVELAPLSPQYREYLGEYFHLLKRPEDALATWRKMAEGEARTATNLARLADVLTQFGYAQQALSEIAAACELDPKDFSLQLKAADLQIRGEQYDAALASLARAEKLAQNEEEREAILSQQIKTYTHQDKLADLARQLDQLATAGSATREQWYLLARYREALREYPEATKAINEAIAREPTSIPALAAAARIAEQAGDLRRAADLNRNLAISDRRGRSTYLERVAGLEAQLGRTEEALAAGKELIAATPGNVETYQFFAELCFRLGRGEEGLAALRRATRVNPNEPSLLVSLAAALANQFRLEEATEVYWQAYEKERELDDKLTIISRLADLYLQMNHFDRLLERLARGRREADQRREMTIALAQAYHSAGDYGMARQELESLLDENTRDTQLLSQLSKLAESEADFAAAVKYQEQVVSIAPGAETEYRLAAILARAGDQQASAAVTARLAAKETDTNRLLRSIDGLLSSGQEEAALGILEVKVRENSADWELLYRHGVAVAKRDPAVAARSFEAILNQSLPDEEPATSAKAQQRPAGAATAASLGSGPFGRLTAQSLVRSAAGLDESRNLIVSTTSRGVWMPATHGQARMAAIGWLYRLAADAKKGEDFVAERRQQIESPTTSVRELWDWLYLQSLRMETAEILPAARRLAELGDSSGQAEFLQWALNPSALPAYVITVGEPAPAAEPLAPADLDLAVRCFDALQANRHETSLRPAAGLITALRRAGRNEEAERRYREITALNDTPRQILAALVVAIDCDDTPQALVLLDRFAKKELAGAGANTSTAAADRARVAAALQRLATAKHVQPSTLLSLHDHFMEYHVAWSSQRRNNPLARQSASNVAARATGTTFLAAGGTVRRVAFTYPAPSTYFDNYALTLLRLIYEQFKQQDLMSDLVKHLQLRASAAESEEIYDTLALSYVFAWNEDQEAAHKMLATAIGLAPHDDELKLDTARLFTQSERYDDALALVDAIAPKDQRTLQQRETLALDLAVRLADHERAREAAQRLFGLRLDAETQVNLAGQMRRLGMQAEANAVLARSQRQAGSRLSALAALMEQYQAQGQTEQAVQVAQRIVRLTRTAPSSQVASGTTSSESQHRTLAIQCLTKNGKLFETIATLEEQIRRTPTATQLYESLAEYYRLSGDAPKANALTAKLVELKPDDADLRYRYAQELYRQRNMAAACEQYKIVIKTQPQLISRRYFEVVQAFQQARKEAELVDVLSEIDLKSLGQPFIVTNMLSTMMRSPQNRTAGLALFKKAWEAFPAERMRLMGYLGDELWKLPEVLDYAKQALRPTAEAVRRDPWYGVQVGGMTFGANGQVTSALTRLLSTAATSNRLDEFRQEIAAGSQADANWQAGPVLLALIDLKQRKEVDVAAVVKPLLEGTGNASSLMYTRWIVGQELEARPEHRDLAAKLYGLAAVNGTNTFFQFRFSPGASLVRLYKQLGRRDEALAFLRRAARGEFDSGANVSLPSSMRTEGMVAMAKLFEELDAPADALKTYRAALTETFGSSGPIVMVAGQPTDYFKQQAQQGLQSLLTRLGKQPSDVIALLTPDDKAASGAPAIDLMLGLGAPSPTPLRPIDSPLAQMVKRAGLSADERAQIEAHLALLAKNHPRDLSVGIITALVALGGADTAKKEQSVADLMRLSEETKLEELPAGQRPNSRQRSEASRHIPLWLVARECLKVAEQRDWGQNLADWACAAAQRQVDQSQLASILYERGRLSLEAGDKAAAERQWNELIELTLVQPRQPRASAAAGTNAPKQVGARRQGPIPATASQFAVAATISQAAAERDLVELSLRAIGEALTGGLPVRDAPPGASDPPAAARVRALALQQKGLAGPADPLQQAAAELSSRLWQLSVMWKQRQFPPEKVFQLLAALVFPESRAGEIVLYDQPQGVELLTTRSIGALLVDWASRADQGKELKRQVAARQATAGDVTRGHLLLVELSIALRQPELAGPHLDALAAQLDKTKLNAVQQRVAQAAPAPAAPQPAAQQQTKESPKASPPQPAGSTPAAMDENLQSWWGDLEKTEAVAARALLNMADRPKETVTFLKQNLKPLKITAERVQTLLVNLGSDKEETWKAAYEELEYFDPRLAIDLPTLMNDVTTSPARQRMVEILSQRPVGSLEDKDVTLRPLGSGSDGYNFFDGRGSWWAEHRVERINAGFGNSKNKWTQAVRAIILLEHIGTPEAIAILRDMASGHAEAQPTKLAAEALSRKAEKSP